MIKTEKHALRLKGMRSIRDYRETVSESSFEAWTGTGQVCRQRSQSTHRQWPWKGDNIKGHGCFG